MEWEKRKRPYPGSTGGGIADGGIVDNKVPSAHVKGVLVLVAVKEVCSRRSGEDGEGRGHGDECEMHFGVERGCVC